MAVELKVPAVGESISEVQIGQWLKGEGQAVTKDENVVEIETDKATVEIVAPESGTISRVLKRTGDVALVGEVIGYLEPGGAAATTDAAPAAKTHAAAKPQPSSAAAPQAADTATAAALQAQTAGAIGTSGKVKPAAGGRTVEAPQTASADEREWQEHDLAKYVRAICGQEVGTKKETLTNAKKYPANHTLMIGDAPGDHQAAEANNALFYPINPGHEDASWKRLLDEGIDRFLSGTFAGKYQQDLLAEFDTYLPATPPWKK